MKELRTPCEVLSAGLKVVAASWAAGARYRLINGVPHYDTVGAIESLAHCSSPVLRKKAVDLLVCALPAGWTSLDYYTDVSGRRKDQIVSLYERAIKKASK